MRKPICGICRKFVKIVPEDKRVDEEIINEVKFVCNQHGNITSFVEWINS